jgi:peptidoglycan biosynthesis protein MviN/MurJ (putative lipid II flippase)
LGRIWQNKPNSSFCFATSLAQVGLALATTIGAWLNFALVLWFAPRRGLIHFDRNLARSLECLVVAGAALALALALARRPLAALFADVPRWGDAAILAALAALGVLVYGAMPFAFFAPQWQAALRRRSDASRPSEVNRAGVDLSGRLAGGASTGPWYFAWRAGFGFA